MDFETEEERNARRNFTPPEILRSGHWKDEGAAKRYSERLGLFVDDGDPLPRTRHHVLWLLHNCVAHPLLALGATQPAVEFHELTSQWLNAKLPSGVDARTQQRTVHRVLPVKMPTVEKSFAWVLHNVVAHTAIGLVPCKATFAFHDWSAKKMNVPGWV
jgi:hypothetical protein